MNHQRTLQAAAGFVTNKHNPSAESGLDACISSRITTVIHVGNDHRIGYERYNEPFADSAVGVILRHAWLNL